ncbi:hypothetical protein tb265_08220 [Gemmatimonadetes bacterium T265]|nr:hypothetical protein tb265_08220 [Gemmatimonadetes bacterium T265]
MRPAERADARDGEACGGNEKQGEDGDRQHVATEWEGLRPSVGPQRAVLNATRAFAIVRPLRFAHAFVDESALEV